MRLPGGPDGSGREASGATQGAHQPSSAGMPKATTRAGPSAGRSMVVAEGAAGERRREVVEGHAQVVGESGSDDVGVGDQGDAVPGVGGGQILARGHGAGLDRGERLASGEADPGGRGAHLTP